MNLEATDSDLVVLSADQNMRFAIQGLLNRPKAIGIRSVEAKMYVHPERDPGCLLKADAFLRPFVNKYAHALVVFDLEGCGKEKKGREQLEAEVVKNLERSGWDNRAECIVIEPELENWVFSDSREVDAAMGWVGKTPSLRSWLEGQGFFMPAQGKPSPPKEAMEAALRQVRMPRSSSIYVRLAERVGLGRCTDPAFLKFKDVLQTCFPVQNDE